MEILTVDAILAVQEEVTSLPKIVLPNRMALDLLLASQGGVCQQSMMAVALMQIEVGEL